MSNPTESSDSHLNLIKPSKMTVEIDDELKVSSLTFLPSKFINDLNENNSRYQKLEKIFVVS